MRHPGCGRQLVEGARVGEPDQLGALGLADDRRVAERPARCDPWLDPPPPPVAALDQHVGELGVHRGGDVGGQRPRRRRPDQQVLASWPALVIGKRTVSDRCVSSR